ncbi:hypothetical protein Pelo_3147 [Pelomyxa schiedti]|nr:hypothetical protein Pelo_3147 [Pelomyxa schiedti]
MFSMCASCGFSPDLPSAYTNQLCSPRRSIILYGPYIRTKSPTLKFFVVNSHGMGFRTSLSLLTVVLSSFAISQLRGTCFMKVQPIHSEYHRISLWVIRRIDTVHSIHKSIHSSMIADISSGSGCIPQNSHLEDVSHDSRLYKIEIHPLQTTGAEYGLLLYLATPASHQDSLCLFTLMGASDVNLISYAHPNVIRSSNRLS